MVIFAERIPTYLEVEKFRLILSTFQDGSGMLATKNNDKDWILDHHAKSLPGWRDFERAVALAFDGVAIESKWIYDVILPKPSSANIQYGVSCKMRGELRRVLRRDGKATIELSNAAGAFWDAIKHYTGLNEDTYQENPEEIGKVIIDLVEGWHLNVDINNGGIIDSSNSFFLNLQWNRTTGEYQLFQFPIDLPDPQNITWEIRNRRLVGENSNGIIFEWYGHSGGQLKYYPLVKDALWQSKVFMLEPLPSNLENISFEKASIYFPEIWNKLQ